ncbi:MAG: hypothetical protein CMF70_04920 [Magnetovibrio sp.]|nr:hypothetical protein [Magnetovibrio sp.]
MKRMTIFFLAILVLGSSGCYKDMTRNQRDVLALAAGAAAGGYVGSFFGGGQVMEILFMGGGAAAGALTGYAINQRLQAADRVAYEQTMEHAVANGAAGEVFNWKNPKTGHGGFVRPTSDFIDSSGRTCRRFRTGIAFEDGVASGGGAACQQSDGSWKLLTDDLG